MLLKKFKMLVILTLSVNLLACGTTRIIEPDLPCPPRPELIDVPSTIPVDPEAQRIVIENYLRLISYAKKLEARANCDNDSN